MFGGQKLVKVLPKDKDVEEHNIFTKSLKSQTLNYIFRLVLYWDGFDYHEGEISISVKASKISIIVIGSKISLIIKGSKIS